MGRQSGEAVVQAGLAPCLLETGEQGVKSVGRVPSRAVAQKVAN